MARHGGVITNRAKMILKKILEGKLSIGIRCFLQSFILLGCLQMSSQYSDLMVLHKGEGYTRDVARPIQLSSRDAVGAALLSNHKSIFDFVEQETQNMDSNMKVPSFGVLEIILVSEYSRSKIRYSNTLDSSIAFLKGLRKVSSKNSMFKLEVEEMIAHLQFPKSRNDITEQEQAIAFRNLLESKSVNTRFSDLSLEIRDSIYRLFPEGICNVDSAVERYTHGSFDMFKIGVLEVNHKFGNGVFVVHDRASHQFACIGFPNEALTSNLVFPDLIGFSVDSIQVDSMNLVFAGCSKSPTWVLSYSFGESRALAFFDALTGKHVELGDCDLRHDYYLKLVPRPH